MNLISFLISLFASSLFQMEAPRYVPLEFILIPLFLVVFAFFVARMYFPRRTKKSTKS